MWEGCSQPAACMHPLCAHPCVQILLCPTPSLIWISCALFGLDHRSTLIKPRSSSLRSMNKHQLRATFSMLMSSFLQVPFTWLCFPIWASSIREFTPCVKDTTLPMPVTYHNDIRRHFFHEVKQSHLGRNDLPEAYSRKPMSRQCNPLSLRHIQDLPLWIFFQFVPCNTSHWVPSGLFQMLKGPLSRKPQYTLSEPHEDSGMCSGTNEVSLCRIEHKYRLCVGVDVLSVSALNVVSELIISREENEWGLPEPHLSWNKLLNRESWDSAGRLFLALFLSLTKIYV